MFTESRYHARMANHFSSDTELLRAEIAAAAARLIAEDGMDYSGAKRKAAKQILGNNKVRGDILPDNAQVEEEVRIYNDLFFGDTQPARLLHLRTLAVDVMQMLTEFHPFLVGAVLNGTAGMHSDIHLHAFADSPKDIEIFLLNKKIDFEVSEAAHFKARQDPLEVLSFLWRQESVHVTVYQFADLRNMPKHAYERADMAEVNALIEGSHA
jgi:hypothetical protein